MRETPRNPVLLIDSVKNYRTASLLVCKQSLLVLITNGKAKTRVAKAGWPEQGGWRPGGQESPLWQESQGRESFVLRTYIVGKMGVKKFTY